jgi:hypothetical protein
MEGAGEKTNIEMYDFFGHFRGSEGSEGSINCSGMPFGAVLCYLVLLLGTLGQTIFCSFLLNNGFFERMGGNTL